MTITDALKNGWMSVLTLVYMAGMLLMMVGAICDFVDGRGERPRDAHDLEDTASQARNIVFWGGAGVMAIAIAVMILVDRI